MTRFQNDFRFRTFSSHLLIAAGALLAGCTGGIVRDGGEPVAGADVRIWTCDSVGDFQTVTGDGGEWAFNPTHPVLPTFDNSKFIPPGPIAIIVESAAFDFVARRMHAYDDTCRMQQAASSATCRARSTTSTART